MKYRILGFMHNSSILKLWLYFISVNQCEVQWIYMWSLSKYETCTINVAMSVNPEWNAQTNEISHLITKPSM